MAATTESRTPRSGLTLRDLVAALPPPARKLYRAAVAGTDFPDLFNPFRDRDPACDLAQGPVLRKRNLASFLGAMSRPDRPRDLWLAEAPGATGTRRTGIPLVDEREVPLANRWLGCAPPLTRSTRDALPGATTTGVAIWEQIERCGYAPVLWNVLLHHPARPGERLGNRPPRAAELRCFTPLVRAAYEAFCLPEGTQAGGAPPRVIAIGRYAERAARELGLPRVHYVRHPAQGGLPAFRAGMRELYRDRVPD